MRNKTAVATTTIRLLENARYEVLPTASIEEKLLEHVPVDRTLTVTASPSKGLEPTLDLAERLTGHGYVTVPTSPPGWCATRPSWPRSASGSAARASPGLRARRRRRPARCLS